MITITPQAIAHLKKLRDAEKGIGFRLSIKRTGCSGYAYVPAIVQEANENDIHCQHDNLDIYIDSAYHELLKDIAIDYVDEQMGLKQKRLVFINPNEKNKCGCGESFTIE